MIQKKKNASADKSAYRFDLRFCWLLRGQGDMERLPCLEVSLGLSLIDAQYMGMFVENRHDSCLNALYNHDLPSNLIPMKKGLLSLNGF